MAVGRSRGPDHKRPRPFKLQDASPPSPRHQVALPGLLAAIAAALRGSGCEAVVFGSRVRGEARASCDIDILLVPGPDVPAEREWEVKARIRAACTAADIDCQLISPKRTTPEFCERVAAVGLRVGSEGMPPKLPTSWPPLVEGWEGDEPPRWLSAPIRQAIENLEHATSRLDDALEAHDASDRPTSVVVALQHAAESTARGVRRILACIGEEVPRGDPATNMTSAVILGAATRPNTVFSVDGPLLRPPLDPCLRGALLSLSDAADAAVSLSPLDSGMMVAHLVSSARQLADCALIDAFTVWLREMGAPEHLLTTDYDPDSCTVPSGP